MDWNDGIDIGTGITIAGCEARCANSRLAFGGCAARCANNAPLTEILAGWARKPLSDIVRCGISLRYILHQALRCGISLRSLKPFRGTDIVQENDSIVRVTEEPRKTNGSFPKFSSKPSGKSVSCNLTCMTEAKRKLQRKLTSQPQRNLTSSFLGYCCTGIQVSGLLNSSFLESE